MSKPKLPKSDSIQQLAEFWDTHDLTDFETEMEVVGKPVFSRRGKTTASVLVPLNASEAKAINRLAQAKGMSAQELIRTWVQQKIRRRSA
jgi:predicted DNA binding CopG/RHH family protein